MGHHVEVVGPWAMVMGSAQAVRIDREGVFWGGADLRGDGAAMGV